MKEFQNSESAEHRSKAGGPVRSSENARGVVRRGSRRLLLLGAASFYAPLTLLSEYWVVITRGYRLVGVGFVILGVSWLAAGLLSRYALPSRTSTNVVTLATVYLTLGGRLSRSLLGGHLMLIGLLVLSIAAIVRLRNLKAADLVVTWLALTLLLGIGAAGLMAVASYKPSPVKPSADSEIEVDADLGDVAIVIFDEYPSAQTAHERGVDIAGHVTGLRREGFEVYPELAANYAFTEMSLPAFFLLDLPLTEGDSLSEADRHGLYALIGGESPFMRAFVRSGYKATVVESGWSGLRCMGIIHECVPRSIYDEVLATLINDSSLATRASSLLGSAFVHGTKRNLHWIEQHLSSLGDNNRRDIVIVHLMLPHWPIVFDPTCVVVEELKVDDVDRWADQVACANQTMAEVSSATQDFGLTVFMGDHGSQTQGQVDLAPEAWNPSMVRERMNTLAAVRGLDRCTEPAATSLTDLAVRIINCVSTTAMIERVPANSYVTSTRGEPLIAVDSVSGNQK